MVYLKIILLKVARYFAIMIWNIIRFFRWNKSIDLRTIKKIIFNRKDRIWDAVISKPFIILFSKYIKEELKLNIEIEVECSKYNEFIFKEWNGEKFYKINSKEVVLKSYDFSFFWYIKERLKWIKDNKKLIINKNIIYIDLVWDIQQTKEARNTYNSYIIWWNLLFNNYMIDYSINENYVAWNKNNLIKSYIELVSKCFKLQNFESYVNENIEYFFKDYNYSKDKKWILIFVWNKKFRNLPIDIRNKIINWVWKKYKDENVVIIDDNQNIIYNELIKIWWYPNNIIFQKNEFSLQELKAFTKDFKLLIWIDWGWFNYIRTCTNSLEIFTIANHHVRHIYSWTSDYTSENIWNHYIANRVNIWWKNFWYIYKNSIRLQWLDIEISKNIFNGFPINELLKESEKLFGK